MTKAFVPLFANNFRVMFGLSKDYKQRRKDIAIYAVLAALMLPVLILVCVGVYYVSKNATPDMLVSMISSIMFASEVVVLFFGVQSSISILFFAKDNELLMALPVTGLDIFLSKFLTIYLLHLGLALLMQLPILLVMGIAVGIKSFGYYILGLLGSVLTPFIPLFILTIIAVPLGYVISYFKRNNLVGTILVLLLFGGVFAGYYYLIFAFQKGAQSGVLDMNAMQEAMKIMSYIIYPNTFIATSMLTTGLTAFKNFAIFFAIIVGLATISVLLSAFLYKSSARRGFESGSKKVLKEKDNEVKSITSSLLTRDIKSCLGSTASAINYLIGLVLCPIIMVMLSLIYSGDTAMTGDAPLNSVAVSLAFIFGCGMNYFSIVAFSREGRQMDVLKMLPVSSKKVVNQKILLSVCYTIAIDIVLLASMFIAKINYVTILMLFICVLIAGSSTGIFGIYFDLKSPNFVWNTHKELFKNNSKSLTSMALALPLMIFAIAGNICFEVVFAEAFSDVAIRSFMGMLPAFILSIVYASLAVLWVYPKLEKMYECLEI